MKVRRSKSIEYLVQLLIVMVGVFLGMLVSDWNAERKLNQNRKVVLASIKKELEANRALVKNNRERMLPFYSSFDSLFRNNLISEELGLEKFYDRGFYERLPDWNGLGHDRVSSAMFESAKSSGVIPGMKIILLEQLSSTYSLQELDKSMNNSFLEHFWAIDNETTYIEVIRIADRIRQELNSLRTLLIAEYDASIELIEQEL